MIKPTMSMCVNLTDYHKQTIKWQADRIEALEEALREAKVIMEKVAYNKDHSLLWGEYNELRIQAAKIASVLDNTEES